MTSKHRDRSCLKERGSVREGNPTDDTEGVNIVVNPVSVFNGTMREGDTSQLIQTTGNNSQQSDRDRKRMIHNEVEKKRKEKIKYWISKIGEILPTITLKERETPSTLEIVEKAYQYIVELREKNEQLMQARVDQEEGVSMLNMDIDWDGKKTGSKSDTSSAFLDSSGDNSTEIKSTNNGVSSTTDGTCSGSKEDTSKSKSKNKRRNTISVQLENLKNARSQHEKEVQSQQELITSSVSVPEEMNIIGTAQMGGVHGNQFLGHHNMLYNQVMVTGNNQFMMQGGMQNSMQGNMSHSLGSSMGNTFGNSGMSNEKASTETAGTGLLQLAMQDAGITPHSGGHGNHLGEGLSVSAPATPAPELTSEEEQIEGSSPQNSALQTLASVASKTQNMSMAGGMGSSSVPGMSSSQMIQSNALMTCTTQTISSNIPIMSTGHMPGYQQMVHAGNNVYNMQMSVPMNVLQNSGMSGPVQHQQIMFINEQGFPMIATVPLGVDVNNPSSANKVNSFSQQHLMKDQQNMDPSSMNNQAMVLAQQQANLLQNQMMGSNASQFQNIALQQQNMLLQQQQISGQFQGNQFIQSQAQGQGQFQGHFQLQGQHQFQVPGSNGQIPGIMQQNTNLVLPVNQNGSYLALNTVPNQASQLPSALILPNGQIIPVVSNPQTLTSQTGIINANAQMQQRVGVQQQFQAQFQTGADGTLTQSNSTLMNHNQMIVGQGQAQGQIHIHSVQQGQGQPQSVHQSQIQDQQSMDILMTTSSANQKSSVASSSTTNAVSNSSMQNMVMTTQVKSSASQKTDAYTAANIHPDTNVTNMMGHGMRNVSAAQGIVTLPSGHISGTDNPGIQPQSVPPNQTSYQSQAMQQVPTKSTPILITLPVNGQPTSVLVDPTTMQVLGQFQPPVSTQSQIQTSVATNQTGMPSTPTTMPTTASTSSSSSSKKNKKNNQRTICPKPTTGGSDGTKTSTGSSSSSKKKSKSSIKADKEPAEQPDSVSDGLHIEIPESTMEPDTSTHTTESTSSETDILAKAAESIFSSPNEISPTISGFYNPANEDNPLHIDTSAGETEDDGNASPQKQAMEVERDNNDGQGSNNKQGGNRPEKDSGSVGENNSSNVRNANSIASSSCDQDINNDGTTKEIGIGKLPDSMTDLFHESQTEDRTLEIHMDMTEDHFMEPAVTSACVEAKKNKKSKKPSTNSISLENQTKPKPEVQQMQDNKGKVTSKKQGTEEIIFPETITFSENELDDVLDRVESAVLDGADGFGTSLTDSCESPGTASKSSGGKKSKSKRNRTTADAEQEPPNKKTKQCKDKTNKMSDQTNVKHMSVYDFNGDASDDIGSPLLPLHLSKSSVAPDAPSMPLLVKSSGPEMVITAESNPHPQHSPSKSQTSSKKLSKSTSNSQNKLQSEAGKGISNSQAKISSEPITSSPLSAPVLSSPKLNRSSAKMTTDNLNPVGTANESPKVTQSSTISYYPTPADKRVASREQSSSSTIVSQTLESITGLNTVTNMDANSSLLSLSMTSMSPTFSTLDDASPPHNSSKSSSNMQVNDTSPRSSLNTHTTSQNPNIVQPNSNNPLNQGIYDSQRDSSGIDSSNQTVSGSSQPSSNSLQSRNTQDSAQTKNNSGITSSERGVTEPNTLKSPHASFGSPPPNFSSSAGELISVTTNSLTLPSDYTMTSVAKEPLPASSSSNTFNRNNFSSPYSAEMLFTSPAKQGINVKSPHGQSTIATSAKDIRNKSNANSSMPDILKQQNKIYSAENFVHSSQNDILRNQPEPMRGDKRQSANKQLRSVNTDTSDGSFARLQNESSSDAFNFSNIGLNLTPIASSGSSYMDSLNLPGSTPVPVSANSFSFSLSSATGTTKSTGSSVGHHPFSFYPMLSSVSQPSQFSPSIAMSQSQQPPQMSPGLFRHELNRGDNSHEVTNKPSCSKEKMTSSHGQSSMQEPFSFSMSRSNTSHEHMSHDQNYFSDPQRRQGIADANKNQSDQLRNTQKQLTDVSNSQSRNPSSSQTEKRNVTSMERTPQLHSSNQPYFSPTGFSSSQPMNTPPLHHPPLLSNEENRRTMTNRSPYDSNFTNPSNQGFSSLNLPYGGNRYEGGSMNFNRDSSGTQPLSHTPPNQSSAGRKSANPPTSSENTKSTKQPQSQLPMKPQQHPPVSQGPMSGPVAPSSSSRPTPPNPSLRHTPPQITPPQSVPANQQMPQPRQQKQSSRASKQQKKNNKQLYPEVDSNLSHSIFEPNRSMTPFFPLQNLSPQSRAVQGEGPPFLPGNFFNPGSRLANSNTPMPKTSDISFNQLFQPGRSQNGLGLNFQPGFGMNMNMNMNMNSVHGNHGNGPITPHSGSVGVTPHMGNFSLSNIFSDSASQSESLNISPIKFSHTNPILSHQPGMDPNSLQHHHQGSSLYHNRSHPPTPSMMSINSILGPNPHGFDGRSIGQINTSMAPPFHGHGNPAMFAMPPLNFSMHDH